MNDSEFEAFLQSCSRNTPEGSVSDSTLRTINEHLRHSPPHRSLETGCGRTTLLLSRLSGHHTVFCVEDSGNRQIAAATAPGSTIEWVYGPSQKTLPQYSFAAPIDFALIDGPHAYPFPELEYFYIYPHLAEGAWLLIDDIQIPTIHNLFSFLKEDRMFDYVTRSGDTAFFRRTAAPLFSPFEDNWWLQQYNTNHLYRLKPWAVKLKIQLRRILGRATH
jgi:hypothetical protein